VTVTRTKISRRDALKASAVLVAPFIAKYSRGAGPMAGKRMGYSMSFATIEWLVTQRRGVEEAAKTAGFELVFADARDNPAKQVRDLEDMITQKCDVILISTYYAEAITPAVKMINDVGIPLVVLSSSIKGNITWTCHLSTDTLGTAHAAGEYFVKNLGGKGRVVQIEGKPGSVVNQMRGTGWTEVIAKNPGIELGPEEIEKVIASDRTSWVNFAHALHDAGMTAFKAIEAKNADALLDAGEAIDTACENCHLKYWYPLSEQATKAKEGAGSVRKS